MIGKDLLSNLIDNSYNFTEEDIIFIAKNANGRIMWLEKGNETAGLTHIISRHCDDFKRAFGLNEEQIPKFLYDVVIKGSIVKEIISKNGTGIDIIYDYQGKYFTFVGAGSNGFIVTAFPTG